MIFFSELQENKSELSNKNELIVYLFLWCKLADCLKNKIPFLIDHNYLHIITEKMFTTSYWDIPVDMYTAFRCVWMWSPFKHLLVLDKNKDTYHLHLFDVTLKHGTDLNYSIHGHGSSLEVWKYHRWTDTKQQSPNSTVTLSLKTNAQTHTPPGSRRFPENSSENSDNEQEEQLS